MLKKLITGNFEYKEDKLTMQLLNLNTKTIENKHFIHHLKRFSQTLSVCFKMSKSKHNYQCFLILVQRFSACRLFVHFPESFPRMLDCFHNTNFH